MSMVNKKQYDDPSKYETKLEKVMERLKVEKYDYNWDRWSGWVEFWYKGNKYRFEHSIENARNHGHDVKYGSDIFSQVVLSLEDIARMTERGIYELHVWINGMLMLPESKDIPDCFKVLGFAKIPGCVEELHTRYKKLVKMAHPDAGGSAELFITYKKSYDEALSMYKNEVQDYADKNN